jgi:hypothetical protein
MKMAAKKKRQHAVPGNATPPVQQETFGNSLLISATVQRRIRLGLIEITCPKNRFGSLLFPQ